MKTIFFDLDDTLFKSPELRKKRDVAINQHLGPKLQEYLEYKKTSSTLTALKKVGIKKEEFYNIIESVSFQLDQDPALINLLENLKKEYQLIIISNSSNKMIKETLKQLGIINVIDDYYGGDSFENEKPSQESFSLVQEDDICVGNNFAKDLAIPKQKKAKTILISPINSPEVDVTIPSIYDLKEALDLLKTKSF